MRSDVVVRRIVFSRTMCDEVIFINRLKEKKYKRLNDDITNRASAGAEGGWDIVDSKRKQ